MKHFWFNKTTLKKNNNSLMKNKVWKNNCLFRLKRNYKLPNINNLKMNVSNNNLFKNNYKIKYKNHKYNKCK